MAVSSNQRLKHNPEATSCSFAAGGVGGRGGGGVCIGSFSRKTRREKKARCDASYRIFFLFRHGGADLVKGSFQRCVFRKHLQQKYTTAKQYRKETVRVLTFHRRGGCFANMRQLRLLCYNNTSLSAADRFPLVLTRLPHVHPRQLTSNAPGSKATSQRIIGCTCAARRLRLS